MKFFRQFCITVVLAVTLSMTAFAGEIPCGIVDPPPVPSASAAPVTENEADGEIPCGIADSITGLTSNFVQSLIAMF